MTQTPTKAPPRYQKVRELGQTENGARITYLAKDRKTGQPVVLKQYNLGRNTPDWAGASAYAETCQTLARLDYPNIARYRNFLPLKEGFCTVRDYFPGKSLAELKGANLEQWKKIAIALLETLVFLQSQSPKVIHRNLKPQNIIVDGEFNLHIVDFGFGFIDSRGKEKHATAGTPGFMPREQLQNKELTEASDLYGLGATLVCLLGQIPSTEIHKYLGEKSDFDLRAALPKTASFELLDWLEKMTQTSPARRFNNAAAALEALQGIELTRSPQAVLDWDSIELIAPEYGEIVTAWITVRNTVPDTILQGRWEIAEHPSDKKKRVKWIIFKPQQFESNKIDCEIAIDTRRLLAGESYDREILLHSNDAASPHRISLHLVTPAFETEKLPIFWLIGLFCLALVGGAIGSWLLGGGEGGSGMLFYGVLLFGYGLGALGGLTGAFDLWAIAGATFPFSYGLTRFFVPRPFRWLLRIGHLTGFAAFWSAGYIARHHFRKKLPSASEGLFSFNVLLTSAIASFGIALGLVLHGGVLNFLLLLATGTASGVLLFLTISRAAQRSAEYRKLQPSLLKP